MKLAFYRADKDTALGKWINFLSGNKGYSHVELVFSDGVSFSSTTYPEADGHDGVRFTSDISFSPDKWDFANITVTPETEAKMRETAESLIGARYDYWGVIRFVLPFAKEHPNDWFCSEAVLAVLQSGGLWTGYQPWKVSPNQLAQIVGLIR